MRCTAAITHCRNLDILVLTWSKSDHFARRTDRLTDRPTKPQREAQQRSTRPPVITEMGTHSLTAALDQLRVVASSTSNDPGPRSRQHQQIGQRRRWVMAVKLRIKHSVKNFNGNMTKSSNRSFFYFLKLVFACQIK